MALSGTISTNVGAYWKLQLEWTASQNVAGNSSTITSKLYWLSTSSSYGAVYSSATKDYSHTVNGSTVTGNSTAGLSGGQKKLINSRSVVVPHNSDGTKTVSFSAFFDIEVTLSGTYYGRVSLSGSGTLNTIPRASTLSSSASWTLPNALPITISRASTSFTHTASLYVNGTLIKQITGIGTSTTVNFTVTENKNMFTQLAQGVSKATSIEIKTYSGGTLIGTTTKAGTLTASNSSGISGGLDVSKYTDESFYFSISRADVNITHTVQFAFEGTAVRTLYGVGYSDTVVWTVAELNTIHSKIPNAKKGDGVITLTSYYDGVQVRTPTTQAFTLEVRNGEPVFTIGQTSHVDNNSVTVAITGNSQILIQDKSSARVYVNSTATPQKGATISHYVVALGNRTGNINATTGNVVLGTINSGLDQTLTVKAVDSRGFETTVAKTVDMVAYNAPAVTSSAERANKFEASTTLKISGSFAPVTIGTPKNTIQTITYKTRIKYGSWSAPITKPFTVTGSGYGTTDTIITLDNTKAYDIQVAVTDKFETRVVDLVVNQGQPILFMDSVKKSVAVGKFPVGVGTFEAVKATIDEFTGVTSWTNNTDIGQIIIAPPSNYNAMIVFKKQGVQLGRIYSYYVDSSMRIEATNDLQLSGTKIILNSPTRISPVADASGTSTNHALTIGASDTVGDSLKIDDNEISAFTGGGTSDLHINPDGGDVAFANNTANKMRYKPSDGFLYQSRYKHPNGYNQLGVRDGTTTNNDTYMIQNVLVSVNMGGTAQAYADVSFPTSFSDEPLWIVAQPVNVNSASYKSAVYAPTTSGCRVYMSQIHNGTYTGIIQAQIIACGRKVSTFA